jgi:hypothetical protein
MISIKVDPLPALDIVHTFSGGFVRNKSPMDLMYLLPSSKPYFLYITGEVLITMDVPVMS